MSIQIISQRSFEGKKPVFVYLNGTSVGARVPNLITLFRKRFEIIDKIPENERYNLFYTLAHHNGTEGAVKPMRTAATFDYQTVLPFDIDSADTTRALEYATCVCQAMDTPLESALVINSGNGLHVLFHLAIPIRQVKFFSDARGAYKEICYKIALKMKDAGLSGNVDPSIFEPARVLRLPNTKNIKAGRDEKECFVVQESFTELDLDLYKISGQKAASEENVSPAEVKRHYPNPDLPAMVQGCDFMRWALEKTEEVHEPHAFDLLSLLACAKEDSEVEVGGKIYHPKELGKFVTENAVNSVSLNSQDFDQKWEQAKRYGGRKCSTINEHWPRGCEGCPHFAKIATPLALKSKEHISSEPNGYWVLNAKGMPLHPHYADLQKVYTSDQPHLVTSDERIFIYKNGFYQETTSRLVKAWLDRTVIPVEFLREVHRNEFLNKILSTPHSLEHEQDIFVTRVYGKLNCKNGILDLLTGELLPHSPDIGFKYVLPYDYSPGVSSEYFMSWLKTIMQGRQELIEAVLDTMAYCLWPSYDDHMFTFLSGDGSNGKSTLIEIIQALVGRENVSNVSIQQLGGNRFAPAALEGKLVNLSEESSGYEMGFEEMNIIKNLSSGGTMQAEKKGEQGFSFTNMAKLIFSANKPPRFQESGMALKRRLVVIPFDYTITSPDANVKTRLITTEIPGIMSLLVQRLRDNVTKHSGKFITFRGGVAAEEAQRNILTYGNSVVEWAKESIESTVNLPENQYIKVSDAYFHYSDWCKTNGYKYFCNKSSFGKTMVDFVLADNSTHVLRVDDRVSRVYRFTRWKEEAYD